MRPRAYGKEAWCSTQLRTMKLVGLHSWSLHHPLKAVQPVGSSSSLTSSANTWVALSRSSKQKRRDHPQDVQPRHTARVKIRSVSIATLPSGNTRTCALGFACRTSSATCSAVSWSRYRMSLEVNCAIVSAVQVQGREPGVHNVGYPPPHFALLQCVSVPKTSTVPGPREPQVVPHCVIR